jgi:hypothetical protein
MSVAEKFLSELREGNLSEAIDTIKSGLKESTDTAINEVRSSVLEQHGFVPLDEKKKKYDEDEESEDE